MSLTIIFQCFNHQFSHFGRAVDEHNEFKMNGVTPRPQVYYQVLIDQRDCPYVVSLNLDFCTFLSFFLFTTESTNGSCNFLG